MASRAKNGDFQVWPKYPMWVLYTCARRCLTRCKQIQVNLIIPSQENIQNGPKCPIFTTFWTFSQDWIIRIGLIYLLEKKPRSILTPFLTISVMNWVPGAFICPLMRYWHSETIFGLELQEIPSAGGNFIHTLIWTNLTLFWKKKWNLRCGVAVAAKMAKNGRKMAENGQTIKCIILA